jgi:hypothetical protein
MNPCANAKIRTSAAVLAAVASVCALANPAPASDGTFAHYQVILDRQPFGVPPAPEQAAAAVPKPEPAFTRELRLCGITYNKTSGLRVGIVDQKTQGSYYLGIGDEQDGIMVVDADIEEEFAVIRKEGEERRLYLDGRIVSEPTAPVSLSPEAAAIVSAATGAPSTRVESYADRLRRRREERERQAAAIPEVKITPEELEKNLRELQMKVLREGLPPLPIPLTKEMDDQLVQEGVLPPQ